MNIWLWLNEAGNATKWTKSVAKQAHCFLPLPPHTASAATFCNRPPQRPTTKNQPLPPPIWHSHCQHRTTTIHDRYPSHTALHRPRHQLMLLFKPPPLVSTTCWRRNTSPSFHVIRHRYCSTLFVAAIGTRPKVAHEKEGQLSCRAELCPRSGRCRSSHLQRPQISPPASTFATSTCGNINNELFSSWPKRNISDPFSQWTRHGSVVVASDCGGEMVVVVEEEGVSKSDWSNEPEDPKQINGIGSDRLG